METTNYGEIMDEIAEHDLINYKKVTAFDLYNNNSNKDKESSILALTKQNSLVAGNGLMLG